MMTTECLTLDDPAYFDRLAEVEERHWWSRGMWRIVAYWLDASLAGRAGLRALDVGCGTGLVARRLSLRPEISEVVGIDPSPDALRHAGRFEGIAFREASALDLPFEDREFDVVTCFDVLQHLPIGGDRLACREIARVLRTNGIAVIRSNARGWTGDESAYRMDILRDVISQCSLTIRRATLANALPALAQEVRGGFARRRRSHPSGGGLRIRVPSPVHNKLMGAITNTEAWVAGRLGWPLPFGHSTLLLAERFD